MSELPVIRNAAPDEAMLLSDLAFRSKAYWGYSSEFLASCRNELTLKRDQIASRDGFHVVCEVNGKIVGFYILQRTSSTGFSLDALFIDPRHIGKGYGRRLMSHALQIVSQHAGSTLQIQSDPNATRFYEAAGAYQVGLTESGSIPGRRLPLLQIDISMTGTDTK